MIPRLEVGIDCIDPEALAPFWMAALGYVRGPGDGLPYVNLLHPDGERAGMIVFLQRVEEPKVSKNRVHIDLYVAEPETLIQDLEAIGGLRIGDRVTESSGSWFQIMADPEGNEFCVCLESELKI